MKGYVRPAKLEPPPTQPMTTSGYAPAISICFLASRPITVWWRRTWLTTEPSEYLASSCVAASSTASEIAMPRLPGESGSAARIPRPALVRLVGEAWTVAPQVSIIALRYGFCSYDTLTMYTVTSRPKRAPANASAEPHCPAPVSVVSRLTPSLEL